MSAPALLDLFCCAGAMSDGYAAAGFDVHGVDIDPRALRHYPYPHEVADVLDVLERTGYLDGFAVVHASPPCQGYSRTRALAAAGGWHERQAPYVDLVEPVTEALKAWAARTGGLYVVENVEGAPMPDAVVLCGRAFGLKVKRHRLFLTNAAVLSPGCACDRTRPVGVYGRTGDDIPSGGRTAPNVAAGLDAMGMPAGRMPWKYLTQAVPPAYAEHLGNALLDTLRAGVAS
jgi:DNA (cytosine-5)-methyltransferase 1